MKTNTIKNAELKESDLRMDASFHLSEGRITKKLITFSSLGYINLNKTCDDIFLGNIFKRSYVDNPHFGYPYLTGSDINNIDINSGRFISKKYTKQLEKLKLKKDWILLTCSGTIGNLVFTNELFEDKVGTHDLIRIIPNGKSIKEGYLYAFLASKYGYALITQSNYGAVVQHIEPHHIKNLPIPLISEKIQRKVHDLVIKSSILRAEANMLLDNCKVKILNFMNEVDIKPSKFHKISINDVKKGQIRFDPPVYVSPAVKKINALKSKGLIFKTLRELGIRTYRPGIFKRAYTKSEYGFPYIAGSESFLINPFKACKYVSRKRTPFLEELKLKANEILLMCAGSSSVGKVKLITKEYEEHNSVGSQDIIRIYPSDNFSYAYLFAYLDLPIMFEYIKSFKYGSAIERLEPFHVDEIPILIPDNSLLIDVDSKIKEFQNKLYLSFSFETQAIEIIENEISSWQK